ncbi:MAG: hypothetical protein AAF224_09310 [Pseudomonadota bacterium]
MTRNAKHQRLRQSPWAATIALTSALGAVFGNALLSGAVVSSAASLALTAPAAAQVGQPTLPIDRSSPAKKKSPKCKGKFDEATVDPFRPKRGANHHSIEDAICNAKPGGVILVYRKPGEPYREEIRITKPDLRLQSAERGPVVIAPPVGRPCVTMEPRSSKRFSDVQTTLRSFVFKPAIGAEQTCIDVRIGTLNLEASRIEMNSRGVGVRVSGTGALNFVGARFDEHGIFQTTQSDEGLVGIGVEADASLSVALNAVQLSGLEIGVRSVAEHTRLTNVVMTANGAGVEITDEAISQELAPALTVKGGWFDDNGDGILLLDRMRDPNRPITFRGAVTIKRSEESAVYFRNNDRGLTIDAAGLYQPLTVDGAAFEGNRDVAVSLALNEGAAATFDDVAFRGNAGSIDVRGPLNGLLSLNNVSLFQTRTARPITISEGRGRLEAVFAAVPRKAVSLVLGGRFLSRGRHNVSAPGPRPEQFVRFEQNVALCRLRANDSKDRTRFLRAVDRLSIDVAGAPYFAPYVAGNNQPSRRDVTAFQSAFCLN